MNDPSQSSPEEALRQTRADYQMLVDSLPVCLLRKDRAGRPVFANQPYLEFHNITLEQLIERGEPAAADEHWRNEFQREDRETLAEGRVFQGTMEQRRPDGEVHWIERLKGPQRNADGEIVGIQVLFWVVTHHVEAEQTHQREAALLETLLNSVPDAIYFKDSASRFIRISESMAKMFGLGSAAEAAGKSDADFFTSQHANQAREDELKIMRTGEAVVGRIERETWPDREDTWASSTKLPLRDVDGNTIGTMGLSRDITNVIQVEEQLAHERDRLQTLMDHLPDVVFIKDREGRFLMTNPALNSLYGCESSVELVGRTDFDYIPQEVARHFADDDKAVMQSGEPLVDREESNVDQHGEVLWMLTSKIPLRDPANQVVGLVGIGRDITRLKQAEHAATRKAMEAGLLYEATSLARDTDSLKDAMSGCLSIVCELTGWDIGHVLQPHKGGSQFTYLESMKIWHPGDDERLREFREILESYRIPSGEGMSGVVWETAQPRWLERVEDVLDAEDLQIFHDVGICSAVAFPIVIEQGTVAILEFFAYECQPEDQGLLSVFQSVGEQVGRVIERRRGEDALRDALDAADAANRAKSDFLANVSHEIRTPMNGVIGMTELLMETQLTPIQREYLQMVQSSGESLLDLINDILDFSKIESGKMELEAIPFDFRESLGDTMKLLGTRAHKQRLELAFSIHESVPECLIGDPARLRQVIINLVGNAIKFTEFGEVVLRVTVLSQEGENVRLHFAVSDTGIGIPEEKIDSIFDSFQQADTSTTRSFGGTGLGLAICTSLVDLMQGSISCESEVGKGSVFSFDAKFGVATDYAVKRQNSIVVHGTRTLIVDDNATNRRILMDMCTNWGMLPEAAESAAAGLSLLRASQSDDQSPFRLLLSDVNMPDFDGFQLCEKIRQDPEFNDLQIIMLTSSGRSGDAGRRRELDVAGHLLKPVKQSELFDSIVTVLGVNEAEDAHETEISGDETQVITGLTVLLAEDNLVNQRLAIGLLNKQGHEVTLAVNGAEAVQLYKSHRFDVVLMDVQMPKLDGLEATKEIREYEQQSDVHTPIVAMTAHAMKGDRERCLESGMDEYLTKPIRGKQISEMFAKLKLRPMAVEQAALETQELASRPSDMQTTESLIDWDIAWESVDNDRDLLTLVIEAFLEESPNILREATQSIANNDAKTLNRNGHTLKGALLSLGGKQSAVIAKQLEQLGASGTVEGAQPLLDKLSHHVDRLSEEFTKFCQESPGKDEPQ